MRELVYPTILSVRYDETIYNSEKNRPFFEKRLHKFIKSTIKEMKGSYLFLPNRFFLTKRVGKTKLLKITTKKITKNKDATIYRYYLSPRWKSKYNREAYIEEIRKFIGELMINDFLVTDFDEELFLYGEM